MDLHQLRCFVAVAEELHFGKAAQGLSMLPSGLGRHIQLLETDLGTRLLSRTTRRVSLTEDGAQLLKDARVLLAMADDIAGRFRARGRDKAKFLRVGAIDSAASGLLPFVLQDFRERRPDVTVQFMEGKTSNLMPLLVSGRLDMAFVRPPENPDKAIALSFLFHESVVVALPKRHPLARRRQLSIADLAGESLIVPERRSRPHSHDLAIKLFDEAGLTACIGQVAEEKHTIINLVAANLGVAIVPRWTSRMAVAGVRYIDLKVANRDAMSKLPLAVAWAKDTRDHIRDEMLVMLKERLDAYAKLA